MDTYLRRRTAAAAAVAAGGTGFAVADLVRRLVEPANASPQRLVDAAGQHPGAWLAAGLLSAATAFLLVPGMAGVVTAVRGRGVRVTWIGACLLVVGSIASVGHAAGYFGMYGVYASAGVGDAAVASMDTASEGYALFAVFIALFMVGMVLGPVVLAVGLRRARLVPVWVPVAAVVFAGAGASGGVVAGVVGVLAAVLVFGQVARVLARPEPTPVSAPEPLAA